MWQLLKPPRVPVLRLTTVNRIQNLQLKSFILTLYLPLICRFSFHSGSLCFLLQFHSKQEDCRVGHAVSFFLRHFLKFLPRTLTFSDFQLSFRPINSQVISIVSLPFWMYSLSYTHKKKTINRILIIDEDVSRNTNLSIMNMSFEWRTTDSSQHCDNVISYFAYRY